MNPEITKKLRQTTVRWTPPVPYAPGVKHTASLTFIDRTCEWSFTTTDFPTASFYIEAEDFDYHVYAAISRGVGETNAVVHGELWRVDKDATGILSPRVLGHFAGARALGFGTNDLVLLVDATTDAHVAVALDGQVTMRYVVKEGKGDPDFLLFVVAPRFTSYRLPTPGELELEWMGDGRLEAAAQVGGLWVEVPAAAGTWTLLTSGDDPAPRRRLSLKPSMLQLGGNAVFFRLKADRERRGAS